MTKTNTCCYVLSHTLVSLDRGRVRTREWLNNTTVEERAATIDAHSLIKENLPENSNFHKLSLSVPTMKHLLQDQTMEKAYNMACSGYHVRCCTYCCTLYFGTFLWTIFLVFCILTTMLYFFQALL